MKRYNIQLLKDLLKDGRELKEVAKDCQEKRIFSSNTSRDHQLKEEILIEGSLSSKEKTNEEELSSNENIERIKTTILREFRYYYKFFETYGTKILTEELMHFRIELLLQIINYAIDCCNIDNFASTLIGSCFNLYKWILPYIQDELSHISNQHEDDLLSVTNTVNPINIQDDVVAFPEKERTLYSKSNWYEISFTSIAMVIVKLLHKFPQHRGQINLNNGEAVALLQSFHWQHQYISLGLMWAALINELNQSTASFPSSSSAKNNGKLMRNNSALSEKSVNAEIVSKKGDPTSKIKNESTKKQLTKSKSNVAEATNAGNKENSRRAFMITPNKVSEELFRSGILRSLSWLLIHRNSFIRFLASEVYEVIISLTTENGVLKQIQLNIHQESTFIIQNGVTAISDLWSSLLEQGAIPLLQAILVGFPINHQILPDILPGKQYQKMKSVLMFPEAPIRKTVYLLLRSLVYHLENHFLLRQRMIQSLNHSGNAKLRVNLFSSLIIACNHSQQLGRILFQNLSNKQSLTAVSIQSNSVNTMTNNSSNSVLWLFLISLLESQDIKSIFSVLNYFIDQIISYYQKRLFLKNLRHYSQRTIINEIGTQTLEINRDDYHHRFNNVHINAIHPKLLQLMLAISKSISPVVIIIPTGSRLSATASASGVRMSCPCLDLIEKYGGILFSQIQKQHILQIEQCFIFFQEYFSTEILSSSSILSSIESPSSAAYSKYEKEFKSIHNHLNDHYFVKLEGNYQLWQEIFAHFTDSLPLFQSLLQRITFSQVLECLTMTATYSMPVLVSRYFSVILKLKKISANTLLPILNCLSHLQSPKINDGIGDAKEEDLERSLISREKSFYLYLLLYRECIRYFLSDYEFLSKKKKNGELEEIMKHIYRFTSKIYGL